MDWTLYLERSVETGGANKYLDTLMDRMVDYQRLGDLQFEEICWNWSCSYFTWQSRRVSEIASRTEQGGCLGYSVLDTGLSCTKGVWYIYVWDTGSSILI